MRFPLSEKTWEPEDYIPHNLVDEYEAKGTTKREINTNHQKQNHRRD
jgi:DNA polymerase IIIc chi subunit